MPSTSVAEIDFTDLDNFAHGFPHALFEIHRREAPVFWHAPTRHTPDGEGFWSVATYAETLAVLDAAATYSSERGGHRLAPGDKVLVWEGSANRDERAFRDAARFDLRRDPNPHLAFGHGLHYCLGASLARLEMRGVFEELLARFARIEPAGPPEWTRSNRHTGFRHLPLRLFRG